MPDEISSPLVPQYRDDNAQLQHRIASALGLLVTGEVVRVSSGALEASHVLKASPGVLVSCCGFNNKATDQFIQLHDAVSLPANGAVPIAVIQAFAGQDFSFDIMLRSIPFTTGIVVCNSSTLATLTIGAADCFFTTGRI